MNVKIALVLAACISISVQGMAQQKPSAIAPAEKLSEGWDEIDERLVFLVVRLANTETSLEAVEKALATGGRKKSVKTGEAKKADRDNEAMDRKGGGPVRWSTFYGTTAEKFFYHPTDRNSSYHTATVLRQQGSQADNKVEGGVPAGQGVPAHQRPPQFDYIYRANEKAKERAEAEAAEFKGKIEALSERRQRLEAEQAGLWCEIAFRAVSHYDLDKKPLYRFEPVMGVDTASRESAESMKPASSFMALALSIIDAAQKDQATTFSKIKPAVAQARQNLNDSWLRLAVDATDRTSNEGRFSALAKRLDDVASNLSDSYIVAVEGDQAKDQQRKDTFRALLQESLVKYAQIVLALDEMSGAMKAEWKIKPDVDKPIHFVSLPDVTAVVPSLSSEGLPSKQSGNTGSPGSETRPGKRSSTPSENTDPIRLLQGRWVAISLKVFGKPKNDRAFWQEQKTLTVKNHDFTLVLSDGTLKGDVEVNANVTPNQITFPITTSNPKTHQGMTLLGIYSLDDEQLTIAWNIWGKDKPMPERPAAFNDDQNTIQWVFRKPK